MSCIYAHIFVCAPISQEGAAETLSPNPLLNFVFRFPRPFHSALLTVNICSREVSAPPPICHGLSCPPVGLSPPVVSILKVLNISLDPAHAFAHPLSVLR